MQIIAHRGASRDAPENTLAAIHLAWCQQADALEIDVQLSRDGEIVAFHDSSTRRTAGVRKKVDHQTLAELKALDAGKWKGRKWAGEKIPTLGEVLTTVPKDKQIFIELKCGPEIVPVLVQALKASSCLPSQIVVISFWLSILTVLKQEWPELECGWLVQFHRKRTGLRRVWLPAIQELVRQATSAGVEGLGLSARGPVNARTVRQIQDARLKVCVWTVDSMRQARKLIAAGVNGITTNRPGWLREKLKARLPAKHAK